MKGVKAYNASGALILVFLDSWSLFLTGSDVGYHFVNYFCFLLDYIKPTFATSFNLLHTRWQMHLMRRLLLGLASISPRTQTYHTSL